MKEEKNIIYNRRLNNIAVHKLKKTYKNENTLSKDKSKNISPNKITKKHLKKNIIPSMIIQNCLQVHNTTLTKYNILNINAIIFDQKNHKVATFKNYLIWDESSEFFKRYYKLNESTERIPKISEYYEEYTLFAPVYFGFDGLIILIMNKWIKRKKKYLEYLEDKEDEENDTEKTKNKDFEPLLNIKFSEEKTIEQKSKSKSLITSYNKSKTTLDLSKYIFNDLNFDKININKTNEDENIYLKDKLKENYNSPIKDNNKDNEQIYNKSISFSEIIDELSSNYSIIINNQINKKEKKTLTINIESSNNKKMIEKSNIRASQKKKKYINIIKTQPNGKIPNEHIINFHENGKKKSYIMRHKDLLSKEKNSDNININKDKENKNIGKINYTKKINVNRNINDFNKINYEISKSKKHIISKLNNIKSKMKSSNNSLSTKQNKKIPINKRLTLNTLKTNFNINRNNFINSKRKTNTINNSKKRFNFQGKINLLGINNDNNIIGLINLEDFINKHEYKQSLTERSSGILNFKNNNHNKLKSNSNIYCHISLNKKKESFTHRISKLTKNKTTSLTLPDSVSKIKNIKKDLIHKKNMIYNNKVNKINKTNSNSNSNNNLISNYIKINRSNSKNLIEHKKNLVLKQFNSKKEISYFYKNINNKSNKIFYTNNNINDNRNGMNYCNSISAPQKKKINYLIPKSDSIGNKKIKNQKKINLNLNLHINLNINIDKKNKKTILGNGNLINNTCFKGLLTQRNLNIPQRNTYDKLLSVYHSKNKLTKNLKNEEIFINKKFK